MCVGGEWVQMDSRGLEVGGYAGAGDTLALGVAELSISVAANKIETVTQLLNGRIGRQIVQHTLC